MNDKGRYRQHRAMAHISQATAPLPKIQAQREVYFLGRLVAAYIDIDESKALDELLSEAGISIAPAERTTANTQTVEFLKEIEKLRINQPEGGVRIIVQGKHINLKAVLWEIAASSLALLPKALDPTGISQVVGAAAFGTALIKLKDNITSLTDFQLVVCNAVAKINRQKSESGRVFVEPGASAEEVIQELRRQTGQAPLISLQSSRISAPKFWPKPSTKPPGRSTSWSREPTLGIAVIGQMDAFKVAFRANKKRRANLALDCNNPTKPRVGQRAYRHSQSGPVRLQLRGHARGSPGGT